MCLSHVIHYRHVSIALAVVIRVTDKIIGSPNKLLQCINEPLSVIKHAQTSYIVIDTYVDFSS